MALVDACLALALTPVVLGAFLPLFCLIWVALFLRFALLCSSRRRGALASAARKAAQVGCRAFTLGPWPLSLLTTWCMAWERLRCAQERDQVLYVGLGDEEEPRLVAARELPPAPRLQGQGEVGSSVVRFVIVSDTHGTHRSLVMPHVGARESGLNVVLLHAGDILPQNGNFTCWGARGILHDFNIWVRDLGYARSIVVGGNHDATLDEIGKDRVASEVLTHVSHYLENDSTPPLLPGSTAVVFGTPFCGVTERSKNRAFVFADGQDEPSEEELEKLTRLVQEASQADVILSHYALECEQLTQTLRTQDTKPKLLVVGHHHLGYVASKSSKYAGVYVNASVCKYVELVPACA